MDNHSGGKRKRHYSYNIYCKELCGVGHTYMDATMTVVSQTAYDQWLANQNATNHQRQEAKAIVFSIKEWLSTTNHKQVGILYIVTAIFFMAVAGSFGEMMRTQLAVPNNNFLHPFHL